MIYFGTSKINIWSDTFLFFTQIYGHYLDAVDEDEEGNTIEVCPGTYSEDSPIYLDDDNLTLRSKKGNDVTIIEMNDNLFLIYTQPDVSNIEIRGFELRGTKSRLIMSFKDNRNIYLYDNYICESEGIYFYNCSKVYLINHEFIDNNRCIQAKNSNDLIVGDCTIEYHDEYAGGIKECFSFEGCRVLYLFNNYFHIYNSNDKYIYHYIGSKFRLCEYIRIDDGAFENLNVGISLSKCIWTKINHTDFVNNKFKGIETSYCWYTYIKL